MSCLGHVEEQADPELLSSRGSRKALLCDRQNLGGHSCSPEQGKGNAGMECSPFLASSRSPGRRLATGKRGPSLSAFLAASRAEVEGRELLGQHR